MFSRPPSRPSSRPSSRPPSQKRAQGTRRRFAAEAVPRGLFVRTVLVGALAIAGAAWALVRHYTLTPPPLRVPVPDAAPRAAPTYDADAGEIPVPGWLEPGQKGP